MLFNNQKLVLELFSVNLLISVHTLVNRRCLKLKKLRDFQLTMSRRIDVQVEAVLTLVVEVRQDPPEVL